MSYLLTQMFLYLLGALLLGLALGWILWGQLRGRVAERDAEVARLRAELDRLKVELDACGRSRAELERRLREADSAPTSTQVRTAAPAPQAAASLVSAPAVKAPEPKKAAPRKAAPPITPDDLRRIVGIGPVNEKKLHGLGIRTFAQIAGWKAADIKRVEDVLEFDGRIDRERWVEQAKLLAAGDTAEFLRRFPTAGTDSNT